MRRAGSPPRSIPKTWNLTLDEPALTTKIVSMASRRRQGRDAPARVRVEHRSRARGQPAANRIGARRQDNGDAGAQHDPGRIGPAEENEILGQHVAGFQIRHDKDLGSPGDRRLYSLDACRFWIDCVVEGQRPVEDAAGDLSSIGHLAERRSLDGGWDLRGHGFNSGEDRDARRAEADLGEEIDRVLYDVAFGLEIGKDIDRRIGDEERVRMVRDIHDENMTDPPRRAQAGGGGGNRPHQLVGVQAAFHQQLALSLADQLNGLRGGRIAMRSIDDRKTADVKIMLASHRVNARGRTYKRGNDNAGFGRLYCATQRGFVAWVHNDRRRRRYLLGARYQPIILGVRGLDRSNLRSSHRGMLRFARRRRQSTVRL